MSGSGSRLIGVGVGPGDPELVTVKGVNALRGADVVVYEASERPGGKIHTTPFGRGWFEHGPDAFLARDEVPLELCRSVGLGDDLDQLLAGTGAESIHDGPLREATFAQPSGLAAVEVVGVAVERRHAREHVAHGHRRRPPLAVDGDAEARHPARQGRPGHDQRELAEIRRAADSARTRL